MCDRKLSEFIMMVLQKSNDENFHHCNCFSQNLAENMNDCKTLMINVPIIRCPCLFLLNELYRSVTHNDLSMSIIQAHCQKKILLSFLELLQ